jgi:hypothetical protein
MKKTVSEYEFNRWFKENRPNNFSYEGRQVLFEYLEQYEEDTGEEIEFDPIALCSEYTEYEDLDEFKANYTCEEYQDIEDWDGLNDFTTTIPICGKSFIIANF